MSETIKSNPDVIEGVGQNIISPENPNASQTPPISTEQRLDALDEQMEAQQQRVLNLTKANQRTTSELEEIRKNLGIENTEKPPSVLAIEEELKQVAEENERLEEERQKLLEQKRREELVRLEKQRLLQQKLEVLFEEFRKLENRDIKSIANSGLNANGQNFSSEAMNHLDVESIKALAKAFMEGSFSIPDILQNIPKIFQKIDEELTAEATENVDKLLKEEKEKEDKSSDNNTTTKEEIQSDNVDSDKLA